MDCAPISSQANASDQAHTIDRDAAGVQSMLLQWLLLPYQHKLVTGHDGRLTNGSCFHHMSSVHQYSIFPLSYTENISTE